TSSLCSTQQEPADKTKPNTTEGCTIEEEPDSIQDKEEGDDLTNGSSNPCCLACVSSYPPDNITQDTPTIKRKAREQNKDTEENVSSSQVAQSGSEWSRPSPYEQE